MLVYFLAGLHKMLHANLAEIFRESYTLPILKVIKVWW